MDPNKVCTKCHESKAPDQFYAGRGDCKDCKKASQKARAPQGDRLCSRCKEFKSAADFNTEDHYCRVCRLAYIEEVSRKKSGGDFSDEGPGATVEIYVSPVLHSPCSRKDTAAIGRAIKNDLVHLDLKERLIPDSERETISKKTINRMVWDFNWNYLTTIRAALVIVAGSAEKGCPHCTYADEAIRLLLGSMDDWQGNWCRELDLEVMGPEALDRYHPNWDLRKELSQILKYLGTTELHKKSGAKYGWDRDKS